MGINAPQIAQGEYIAFSLLENTLLQYWGHTHTLLTGTEVGLVIYTFHIIKMFLRARIAIITSGVIIDISLGSLS